MECAGSSAGRFYEHSVAGDPPPSVRRRTLVAMCVCAPTARPIARIVAERVRIAHRAVLTGESHEENDRNHCRRGRAVGRGRPLAQNVKAPAPTAAGAQPSSMMDINLRWSRWTST